MNTPRQFTKVSPSGSVGRNRPETMSVSAYTDVAKKVQSEVNNIIEAGWLAAQEKRVRGEQIQEVLVMASILRYQVHAIQDKGMTPQRKGELRPPQVDFKLAGTTGIATEYIKTVISECKAVLVSLNNENRSLKRTFREISKQATTSVAEDPASEIDVHAIWNNEREMGKILEELDLDDEE